MSSRGLRGVHVFWITFAFFTAVIGADVLFVVRAVRSFPGEVATDAYVRGLDFNAELDRREAQRLRNWTAAIGFSDGSPAELVTRIFAADGGPVSGLDVTAEVLATGRNTEPQQLALVERRSGEYAAAIPAIGPGRLEVEIRAGRFGVGEPLFEARRQLVTR